MACAKCGEASSVKVGAPTSRNLINNVHHLSIPPNTLPIPWKPPEAFQCQCRIMNTMPFPKRSPSRALLNTLLILPSKAPGFRIATYRQTRFESTKPPTPEEGRSFKGQLYESTSNRLQKERIERARFAKERNEGASGRNWSITFGISPLHSVPRIILIRWDSNSSNCRHSLLPRHEIHNQTLHSFHCPSLSNHPPQTQHLRSEFRGCMDGLCRDRREGECLHIGNRP
jgi:hypothetical protein